MARSTTRSDAVIQPAPPDAPIPPAGEPNTARSDAEQRHHRISEAAYYRAQHRGFVPGQEEEDWLEAEKEIEPETAKRK
jgi:hypothetical protein